VIYGNPNTSNLTLRIEDVNDTFNFLHPIPNTVFEACALGSGKTHAGYFSDRGKALAEVTRVNRNVQHKAIFITLNPCKDALLSRSNHEIKVVKSRTSDLDIMNINHFYIDTDPVRPSDTNSSDEEHELALEMMHTIKKDLSEMGWPDPLCGDSGNGGMLVYKIETQTNNKESTDLIQRTLKALALKYDTDKVKVDTSVHNPARLVKLLGTMTRKGDATPDRPQRLSRIISIPEQPEQVMHEQLKALAGEQQKAEQKQKTNTEGRVDVRAYLNHYGREIIKEKNQNGWTLYCLKECVFDPSHTPNEAYIGQEDATGKLSGSCFHNSCKGKGWDEARQIISGNAKLTQFMSGNNSGYQEQQQENVEETRDEEDTPKKKLRAITIKDFLYLELPPRENIVDPWLPTQGLIMVYGYRGIGKTFFIIGLSLAVSSGDKFLKWEVPKPFSVLHIDGEMPAGTVQERYAKLIASQAKEPVAQLKIITPDLQTSGMPNIAHPKGQEMIEEHLDGIDLVIVDNISTLCRYGRENETESWYPIQEWGLKLRSKRISVVFVHHAGKGGFQRGTSSREDVLDTVINLKRPADYQPEQGARFEVHFEKARNVYGDDVNPFEAKLETHEGNLIWTLKDIEESLTDRVVDLLKEGVKQDEIADILGVSKGTISKHKYKAKQAGKWTG